ncbi:MAG: hypothetical protein WBH03_03865 [Cyclobacteriaceae bacterium]
MQNIRLCIILLLVVGCRPPAAQYTYISTDPKYSNNIIELSFEKMDTIGTYYGDFKSNDSTQYYFMAPLNITFLDSNRIDFNLGKLKISKVPMYNISEKDTISSKDNVYAYFLKGIRFFGEYSENQLLLNRVGLNPGSSYDRIMFDRVDQ